MSVLRNNTRSITMRFGKFQSLFTFMVLVLQVAVNELVDADTRRTYPHVYQWPAVQWACEPLLLEALQFRDDEDDNSLPRLQRKTRNLCLKLRGGKLGGSGDQAMAAVSATATSTMEAVTTTTMNETKTETIVVAKARSSSDSTLDTASSSTSSSTITTDAIPSIPTVVSKDFVFPLFQPNDGSESDPDGIPRRYLKMQGNKREQAKKAMEATVEWRNEHDVDTILARPHPKFDICKDVFPHYFCGRDDTNHVILLQRPGLINLDLAHANGLTGDELLFHYVYEMEYLWQIMERNNPDATMTSVIDLTGLNISVLRKAELVAVAKKFVSTMDAHFPQRSHKTYLINAPKWFGAMYKLISPLLRESTKQKIQIYGKGKKQEAALKDLLTESAIPAGKGIEDLPPSEMEIQLRSFCLARLDDAGVDMQAVITI